MRWERPVENLWQPPVSENGAIASLKVTVLLLPPVSLSTLGAILDPLNEANQLGGQHYYDVQIASFDGAPVRLTSGNRLPVDIALPRVFHCHALIVASDTYLPEEEMESVIEPQLSRLQRFGVAFGATRGGTGWLAHAGLLEERRVAVHWDEMSLYREHFPNLIHCSSLYEIDADRFTASSSQVVRDMMLFVIAQQISPELANRIAQQQGLDRIRPGHEKQSVPAESRISQHPQKLTEALQVMEANIEEPLTSDEIANCVGISRRQLERLFKQTMNTLPSKYYQVLRLERSRQLIVRTQKSIVQIGLSCGFSSGSHFATAYRAHFSITPREERARASLSGCVTRNSTSAQIISGLPQESAC